MGLPEKLEELMGRHRVNASELARQGGTFSDTTVGRWLAGESEPRFSDMLKLAQIFDVPVSAFVGDEIGEARIPLEALTDGERLVLEFYRYLNDDPNEGMCPHEGIRRLSLRPPPVG
jgi:transcriptional regulator with XRE-family HTH domain